MSVQGTIRYFYLRNSKNKPYGCVATYIDRNENFIYYQLYSLNSKEQYFNPKRNKFIKYPFLKDKARFIAKQRLIKTPYFIEVDGLNEKNFHDINTYVLQTICDNSSENITKNLAKSWLKKNQKPLKSSEEILFSGKLSRQNNKV